MKNKLSKIFPAVIAIAIIAPGIGLYVRFNGNPITKLKLNKEAEK